MESLFPPDLAFPSSSSNDLRATVASDSRQVIGFVAQSFSGKSVCLVIDCRRELKDFMEKIRVVLADDHRAVVARARQALGDEFEIVDIVEDGNQAVDAVRLLDPDILVIDISMPVLDGLQAAKQLQRPKSRTKVIFLTIHEDHDFVMAALSDGASGYVTKARLSTDLVPAIRAALLGRTFVSQMLSK
jgi:CheY-like chemotaxis protein